MNLLFSDDIVTRELTFVDEMLRWNQRINLTSLRCRDEAIEKHLLDSLLVTGHLSGTEHILDMGSGGGVPGIPLAIAMPHLHVLSVDSVGKKINFQRHIKRLLQLGNLEIQCCRLDENVSDTDRYDLIIARAFASLEQLMRIAAPRLKNGGRLLAMKGPEGRKELIAADQVSRELKFNKSEVYDYVLPFCHAERQLIFLEK